MKAAVLYKNGQIPQYVDFPEPKAKKGDQIVVTVIAAAIKHVDKSRASGKHYSSEAPKGEGKVVGGDGICLLEDGTRVYAIGESGMAAEKALIDQHRIVKVPDGLDDVTAAALPNAVIGSAMGLRFKAGIQPGDIVLINGATSFTGRVAIQIAKHWGAKRVIVTGRNPESLEQLRKIGADQIVSVAQDDEQFMSGIKAIHKETPIDIIIDYLWGRSAELLFNCFKGDGSFSNKIRYVSVGSITGDIVQMSAANLRSVDIQLTGSGMGAWTKKQVQSFFTEILPEMYNLAAEGKIKVDTVQVKLSEINSVWDLDIPGGQRLVVTTGR